MEILTQSITLGAITYYLWLVVQPGMLFENWLKYWAERTINSRGVIHEGLDTEDKIDIAKEYNVWIKPLGACSKCMAPYSAFVVVALSQIIWTNTVQELIQIYFITILTMICLAVKK